MNPSGRSRPASKASPPTPWVPPANTVRVPLVSQTISGNLKNNLAQPVIIGYQLTPAVAEQP